MTDPYDVTSETLVAIRQMDANKASAADRPVILEAQEAAAQIAALAVGAQSYQESADKPETTPDARAAMLRMVDDHRQQIEALFEKINRLAALIGATKRARH
jgi:hypothetical protein